MQAILDGYVELKLALGDEGVSAYVWVCLRDGILDDWGDGVDVETGERISWKDIAAAYKDGGTSFEREHGAEVVAQAAAGLWQAPPDRVLLREGPGLRKAQPISVATPRWSVG